MWAGGNYDIRSTGSSARGQPVERILVLKLDHFGDFVIGLPALASLRAAFPAAFIRLICGRWNMQNALACNLVDETLGFNFFPEKPYSQDTDVDPLGVFDHAARGRFDLAIDMRVDNDTRHLLDRVDAGHRCGIGSAARFPFLDIALPEEHAVRCNPQAEPFRIFPPSQFFTRLPNKQPLHHSGPLVAGNLVHGPRASLPRGKLVAEFAFTVRRHIPGPWASSITFQVVRDGAVIDRRTYGRAAILKLRDNSIIFTFDNPDERALFDFQVYVTGRPLPGTIKFSGVFVHQTEFAPVARYRAAELHIGEQLSLLVALIRERTADLYANVFAQATPTRTRERPKIAIAPFSNSTIRDWPPEYYSRLIAMLLDEGSYEITLIGTAEQIQAASKLKEGINSPFLVDAVGQTSWESVQDVLRDSDLVVCNNSGIAHQAAALGANVLAIYSGSHRPREWGPRGMHVRTLMHEMPCSPCGFERLFECPEQHACMKLITPAYVLAEVNALLRRSPKPLRDSVEAPGVRPLLA